jgi:hypothetical protein
MVVLVRYCCRLVDFVRVSAVVLAQSKEALKQSTEHQGTKHILVDIRERDQALLPKEKRG